MSNNYRVYVTFPEPERELLHKLCMADFRPPDDQLRYLVFSEAKRRGILSDPNRHESAEQLCEPADAGKEPICQHAT